MLRNIWLRQLFALVGKEFQQIVRDPSSYLVAGVLPFIFLLLFGYGITLDAGVLRLGVLNQSGGRHSLSLAADFAHSPWFATRPVGNMADAGRMMRDSAVQGILVIQQDFDEQLERGSAGAVQVLVDGSEPNTAQYIQNYSQGLIMSWQRTALPDGVAAALPINIQPRFWYNPAAKSVQFLVPGAITVIMTLIGTLLTSLVFAREWERGTMEAMFATPVSRMQLLLGKLIPYFCMGMFSMALCAVAAVTLFAVPFRGSLWVLVLLSSVFMLSALGQGLLISVTLRGQLVAAEAGLFSGFLPALLLSGFVFDINSMPPVLQALTRLLPASYFNTCLRTIFLTGDVWGVFGPSLLFMGLLASVLLGLVYRNLVKRLDA
ncbi:ABC transporter permease [Desulfovibrio desulfuricans]|uniref:ABC transporter permease n=1 Tax=Desulfovibrio desulfuricans TaxID=876 RepID=UPI001780C928|nr:ABC transporter permease [Desulfovibrio desulfuricans]MBD8897252.1 ABC transporter permease [Desulfovibrio desulfuricans]